MYLKRWRKCNAEVHRLARSSDDESESDLNISAHEERGPGRTYELSDRENNGNSSGNEISNNEHDENAASPASIHSYSGNEDRTSDENIGSEIDEDINGSDIDSSGSSRVSTEDEESDPDNNDLCQDLAEWANHNKTSRDGLNSLLHIFRKYGHRVPKDSRTLLKTPRHVEIMEKCGGHYIYLGIESGLLKILTQNIRQFANNDELLLDFNIDGIPLFKSCNTQFWPILCSLSKFEPFIVALYCGNSKPNSVQVYLNDFLEEFENLKLNGLTFNERFYSVKLNAFICDAPARSFIKCTVGHIGYYSCERCVIKGEWKGRVVFNTTNNYVPPRTEVEFNAYAYSNHQNARSPLIDAGLSCINAFPLDYMHLVCLGVVKRILMFLKQGPRECRLSQQQLNLISDKLKRLRGHMPREFARQPRSLDHLDKWKATEFRQFVLYSGPLVLKSVISREMYIHFISLTVALTILLDSIKETRDHYLNYAKDLMKYFVKNSTNFYGDTFVSYNVHGLIHLVDDVRNFDTSLNNLSAFRFESYLHQIKKKVRKGQNPIAQVIKRLKEAEKSNIRRIPGRNFMYVSVKKKDGCFLLWNQNFAFVRERRPGRRYVCDTIKPQYLEEFFALPCGSKTFNIAVAKNIQRYFRRQLIEEADIERKVVCLPYEEGSLLMPMLHGVERF